VGGSLFEDDCPHPDPPKQNALIFMFVGRESQYVD